MSLYIQQLMMQSFFSNNFFYSKTLFSALLPWWSNECSSSLMVGLQSWRFQAFFHMHIVHNMQLSMVILCWKSFYIRLRLSHLCSNIYSGSCLSWWILVQFLTWLHFISTGTSVCLVLSERMDLKPSHNINRINHSAVHFLWNY